LQGEEEKNKKRGGERGRKRRWRKRVRKNEGETYINKIDGLIKKKNQKK